MSARVKCKCGVFVYAERDTRGILTLPKRCPNCGRPVPK